MSAGLGQVVKVGNELLWCRPLPVLRAAPLLSALLKLRSSPTCCFLHVHTAWALHVSASTLGEACREVQKLQEVDVNTYAAAQHGVAHRPSNWAAQAIGGMRHSPVSVSLRGGSAVSSGYKKGPEDVPLHFHEYRVCAQLELMISAK